MSRVCFPAVMLLAAVFVPGRADEPKQEPAPAKGPTFQPPKGWESLGADKSGIVTARFRTGEGAKAVTVTLVELGGAGGGLVANVNRWRQQVGLSELAETAALELLKPLKVDGRPAHLLDVAGPTVGDKPAQRVVAVMVKSGSSTWVVKMSEEPEPVEKQKAAFDEFVKSIRFAK